MFNEIHEECGVFGVFSPASNGVADLAYLGLFALQHRGQESCGITVKTTGSSGPTRLGLVRMFSKELENWVRNMVVGHTTWHHWRQRPR